MAAVATDRYARVFNSLEQFNPVNAVMKRLLVAALSCAAAFAATLSSAQVRPPIARQPLPNQIIAKVSDAAACLADRGTPIPFFGSATPSLSGRDLDKFVTQSIRLTNAECRAECRSQGYQFSGTQSGSTCFCGNAVGKYGPAPNCNAPCSGRPLEICGGQLANSVSFTGGTVPPPIPAAPTDGGQCVISVTGPGYQHFETQTWTRVGPPLPPAPGQTAKQYPMQWSVTGAGGSQQLSVSGTQSQTLVRSWTISGAASVTYVATAQGGGYWFHQPTTAVNGTLNEQPQVQTINGVTQTPSQPGSLAWPEFMTSFTGVPGSDGRLRSSMTFQVPATTGVTGSLNYGYARLGNPSGTIVCNWNVVL